MQLEDEGNDVKLGIQCQLFMWPMSSSCGLRDDSEKKMWDVLWLFFLDFVFLFYSCSFEEKRSTRDRERKKKAYTVERPFLGSALEMCMDI